MAVAFDRISALALSAAAVLALGAATGALAQQTDQTVEAPPANTQAPSTFPKTRRCSAAMPSVIRRPRSSTAKSSPRPISTSDWPARARQWRQNSSGGGRPSAQVLRNLIDETLEIQAAKAEKITIKPTDIDKTLARRGERQANPEQLAQFLKPRIRRSRRCAARSRARLRGNVCSAKIESGVSVGEDEVKAVSTAHCLEGTEEYPSARFSCRRRQVLKRRLWATPPRSSNSRKNGVLRICRQYSQSSPPRSAGPGVDAARATAGTDCRRNQADGPGR